MRRWRGCCSPSLRASIADASFNRITIDGDTSTNDSFVIVATGKAPMAPIVALRRSPPSAGARRAGSRRDASWRRRSCATARARPNSSPSSSMAAATPANAIASRAPSPTRRWSRPRFSPPTRISAASSARSATRRSRISIPAACRSGSTTCWSSPTAAAPPTYREEDGKRVMEQDEIGVRVALGRGGAAATRLDLRPVARLRHDQRRLPELAEP